jgi:RNA polymerase sigma-70 factor (ECF subfamily)
VPRLADAGAFRAWLYRIARDRAWREHRRPRPPHRPLDEDDLIDPDAEESTFTAEDVQRVHAALDELVAEHREVLVLRFLEDLTYEEMARIVGCQLGTVRSRLHYAKRALRRLLERNNAHDRERTGQGSPRT